MIQVELNHPFDTRYSPSIKICNIFSISYPAWDSFRVDESLECFTIDNRIGLVTDELENDYEEPAHSSTGRNARYYQVEPNSSNRRGLNRRRVIQYLWYDYQDIVQSPCNTMYLHGAWGRLGCIIATVVFLPPVWGIRMFNLKEKTLIWYPILFNISRDSFLCHLTTRDIWYRY